MTLSRFRKLQESCQLIISMIRNLYQEFSKQKTKVVDSNFAFLTMFQQFTTGARLVTRIPE